MATLVRTDQIQNPYKFSVYRNATLTLTANAFNKIPFDSKEFDTGSNVDIVTNIGRFTVPVAGFYHLSWLASATATSTDSVAVLYKNGTAYKWGTELTVAGLAGTGGSATVQAAVNDYYEVYLYSTVTTGPTTGLSRTYFTGHLVSAT